MTLPNHLHALLDPRSYPHPCGQIELVETHISWVLLTGDFAYKLKKPVSFSFLDFSTLALREHFCREEVRCNTAFAPTLYLGVVAITAAHGHVHVGHPGDSAETKLPQALEWAVKMRQFDPAQALDRLLAREQLGDSVLDSFGASLAKCHAALPVLESAPDTLARRVNGPVEDNFKDIAGTALGKRHAPLLFETRERASQQSRGLQELFEQRLDAGHMRECHGDLHLSNLTLLGGQVHAFDCLEFNEGLRWIDTISDVAFLFMDCHYRGRTALAYRFIDSYLGTNGDYQGARLLPYYAAYRSMVRAKVAALRFEQDASGDAAARFESHLEWAHDWLSRPPGKLLLMCGLSGSGKSFLARQLVPALPAVRLRSDVARKQRAGLALLDRNETCLQSGLYSAHRTDQMYDWLAECACRLLLAGENVIVDAAFLSGHSRARFLQLAATVGSRTAILHCHAHEKLMRDRIEQRVARDDDPSDATVEVLEWQRSRYEPPEADEPVIEVDTAAEQAGRLLDRLRTYLS